MNGRKRVLLIEDDQAIQRGLVNVLVYHGFEVETADDGRRGLELARSGRYDLFIVDVMLPHVDGLSICETIRSAMPEAAVIILTAKSAEEDVVNGLAIGADDYVTKPFSIRELMVRIEAVMRRTMGKSDPVSTIRLGDAVEIDCERQKVRSPAGAVALSRRELSILLHLSRNRHRPVSRSELLKEVWGYRRPGLTDTRTVDIHVAKLRRKIEADPKHPEFLITVRSEGYQLLQAR